MCTPPMIKDLIVSLTMEVRKSQRNLFWTKRGLFCLSSLVEKTHKTNVSQQHKSKRDLKFRLRFLLLFVESKSSHQFTRMRKPLPIRCLRTFRPLQPRVFRYGVLSHETVRLHSVFGVPERLEGGVGSKETERVSCLSSTRDLKEDRRSGV